MKKSILGLIVGLVIGSATTAIAGEFIVERASFPILVNGKVWTTDKPIVTIDGSTYLPLRALGNALGVKVNWNSEKSQVEIGETPTAGYSYSNPAPINTTQSIEVSDVLTKIKAEMTVNEIVRGDKAWELIRAANLFNSPAPEGKEYILVKVNFKLLTSLDNKTFNVNNVNVNLVSSDGKEYDYSFVVTPNDLNATLYPGASSEGYVAYAVNKTDIAPKLVFGRKYDGTGGIWFKAYN